MDKINQINRNVEIRGVASLLKWAIKLAQVQGMSPEKVVARATARKVIRHLSSQLYNKV